MNISFIFIRCFSIVYLCFVLHAVFESRWFCCWLYRVQRSSYKVLLCFISNTSYVMDLKCCFTYFCYYYSKEINSQYEMVSFKQTLISVIKNPTLKNSVINLLQHNTTHYQKVMTQPFLSSIRFSFFDGNKKMSWSNLKRYRKRKYISLSYDFCRFDACQH